MLPPFNHPDDLDMICPNGFSSDDKLSFNGQIIKTTSSVRTFGTAVNNCKQRIYSNLWQQVLLLSVNILLFLVYKRIVIVDHYEQSPVEQGQRRRDYDKNSNHSLRHPINEEKFRQQLLFALTCHVFTFNCEVTEAIYMLASMNCQKCGIWLIPQPASSAITAPECLSNQGVHV